MDIVALFQSLHFAITTGVILQQVVSVQKNFFGGLNRYAVRGHLPVLRENVRRQVEFAE